jgi:hypothetical protein
MSERLFVKKTITVRKDLWREFEVEATRKFGHYGAIKKAVEEAISLWLETQKKRGSQ